jgi:hypothetical protein
LRLESEGREVLPVLGSVLSLHSVSSILLEPGYIGTFSAIAFAWRLVRFWVAPFENLTFMAFVAPLLIVWG